ncbi:aquaporin-7 isoform X2 [Erinaceus europaeus]|uniref:Aquaporin-7 isoform X2 n=1 Tax=Erinaceus europaeus TaxID=9365 RepID=A0ABM3Y2G3_ERIEU|nr:aquaporin-7 isoform X2 [Erinaceus europaeus]
MASQHSPKRFKSMSRPDRTSRATQDTKMTLLPVKTRVQAVLQMAMVREFLAEFLSTYIMMVFGLGSVAHWVLSKDLGSYLGVNLGFGFGVTMGIHIAGNISGAHMNAAITFTSCALGRLPWKKFPVYVLSQFLGSFLAAATTFLLFYGAIMSFSGEQLIVSGPLGTAGIFATYLPDHMTLWRGFLSELCIMAITDKKNSPALEGTHAVVIGILVVIIGISLGMNSGYAINPSRDLPPRFFTFIAGWGNEVFSTKNWWWVPVVAPILGAYLGGLVYLVFIEYSFPQEPQILENYKVSKDDGTPALPKTQPPLTSVNPNSVSTEVTPTVKSAPPPNDTIYIEHL